MDNLSTDELILEFDFARIFFAEEEEEEEASYVVSLKDITKRERAEEELKRQMEESDRFNRLAVGRELKMIELKKRIQELEAERKKQ
jgi:hypothetical protein